MNEPGSTDEPTRWLDQPRNVTRLVHALYAACAALFIADFLYHKHAYFEFEHWWGFYGLYGFASYVFIVMSSKALRRILRREEDYYEQSKTDDAP